LHVPKTSSPGLNSVTFPPTVFNLAGEIETDPIVFRAPQSTHDPHDVGRSLTPWQSSGLTAAARTLIRTSFSLGTGFSVFAMRATSGGPYRSWTAAFISRAAPVYPMSTFA
jgi:hypothetical protein